MKDRFPSLPPGTTPSDIDDHFGAEFDEYSVSLTVGVDMLIRSQGTNGIASFAESEIASAIEDTSTEAQVVGVNIEEIEKI